jgi:predicted PhzF superfamily epimerase YddE/YHI9
METRRTLLVDAFTDEPLAGNVAGVVLSTGSFLGLGGQKVGLAWDQLQQSEEDNESVFYVDMDEETLRNAPEFKSEQEE